MRGGKTMNKNSFICQFIAAHPENWKELLKTDYNIRIKEDKEYPNLCIFNYGIDANFADPIVQEARGIIINTETLNVVCWPFRKFGKYDESYVDDIDWTSARVQEKVDGSIIKLYFNPINNTWTWATNSTTNAAFTQSITMCDNVDHGMFLDIIKSTVNYKDINFDSLDKDTTYIFELVSPYNHVVIHYPEPKLYHTGTRNNITGQESVENINIQHPEEFPLKSFEDCLKAVNQLNKACKTNDLKAEGFVVVDDNWHRIKIKSPEYMMVHHTIGQGNLSKKHILMMIKNPDINMQEIYDNNPNGAYVFKYYDYQLALLKHKADLFAEYARKVYKENNNNRKSTVEILKNEPLRHIGFSALDNHAKGHVFLEKMSIRQLSNLIPDFVEPSYKN